MSAVTDADRKAVMDQLSPEEQAALNEDMSQEEQDALKAIAGDEDGEDDDDGDEDGQASDAAKAVAAPAATKSGEPAPVAAAVEDEDEAAPFKPRYQVELPADLDDQLAALATQEAELAQKMKDGEIEVAEFLVQQKTVAKQIATLEGKRDQAATFEEMNRQTAEQEWEWHVERFVAQVKKKEGIDYFSDKEKGPDFDNFIKVLAAKPENQGKDFQWYLTEAHKRVKVLYGIDDKPKATDPAPVKKDGKPAARKPSVANLPATLANVPGGDGPGDVGGDEFADLDKLDGLEYETALAAMSKAQRDRYLQAA